MAIDIDENNLSVARDCDKNKNVADLISFKMRDTIDTKFENKNFDMVFCGNVTSYFDDKIKAIKEYDRALKDNGFIAVIPVSFTKKPSDILAKEVSEAS